MTYHRYGGPEVLQFEEQERPTPSDNAVLIQTHATTVTSGDWRVRSLTMPAGLGLIARLMFGITGPRQTVLGSELAGEIVEVGNGVTKFKPGDRVVVFTGAKLGCSVQFKCVAESSNIVVLPDDMTFTEAVALPFGGTTALDFFRKGQLQAGNDVLIVGASGCVGAIAVQLGKHFGAQVTGVCSGKNRELVRSLGADEVIDYQQQDVSNSDHKFDVIMDTAATMPFEIATKLLKDDGRLLVVNGGILELLRAPIKKFTGRKKIVAGPAAELIEDVQTLVDLAANQKLRAVVDSIYPVDEIADAHRRVDSGRKTGSVVVTWQ